jgi:hypothetical protein
LTGLGNQGISIFSLYGIPAKFSDCADAERLLKMNFGNDYPEAKFTMLWEMIVEEGWTKERLQSTLKWFLKNKKFPSWTIADWFDYDQKLYPYSWYQQKISEGAKDSDMQGYKINGSVLWCLKGNELPFEKVK